VRFALEAWTNPAVLLDMDSDQRLSPSPFGCGPPSPSALVAFIRAPAVIARPDRRVRLDPLAVRAEPSQPLLRAWARLRESERHGATSEGSLLAEPALQLVRIDANRAADA
jgi:hypothetical protein